MSFLDPSAAAVSAATADASPPGLNPLIKTTPVNLQPVSADAGSAQAFVTATAQIAVIPVQAGSGASAFATAATQISLQPVQAASGAGALATAQTQISLVPVQAESSTGPAVTLMTTQVFLVNNR